MKFCAKKYKKRLNNIISTLETGDEKFWRNYKNLSINNISNIHIILFLIFGNKISIFEVLNLLNLLHKFLFHVQKYIFGRCERCIRIFMVVFRSCVYCFFYLDMFKFDKGNINRTIKRQRKKQVACKKKFMARVERFALLEISLR